MKIKDLRNLRESQLNDRLDEMQAETIKLRAQVAKGVNPENPCKIRQNKLMIARIKKILYDKKQ